MTMMNDLIERLKETRQSRKAAETKTTEPLYVLIHVDDLDEAITALTAPTSEEVQRVIKGIRESFCREGEGCGSMNYCLCGIAEEGADLIERLARERDGWKAQDADGIWLLAEARQRIKELEKEGNEYAEIMAEHLIESDKHDAAMLQRVELAEQQRDEYRKLADDAICLVSQDEAFSLWREMDRIRAMGLVSDGQHV